MQFSQTSQYALRVVSYMALHRADEPFRARDLSESTGVPAHYLSKIMRRLVEGGVLVSQKGHGGGYGLARPAAEISFEDVIQAVDVDALESECVFGWGECGWDNPCPLHPFWSALKERYSEWASGHTIDEVELSPAARKEA